MPPCLENAQFVVLSESRAGFRFPAFFVGLPAAEAPPGRSEDLSLILGEASVEGRGPRFRRRFHSGLHSRAKSPISNWVFHGVFFFGGFLWAWTADWRFFTELLCVAFCPLGVTEVRRLSEINAGAPPSDQTPSSAARPSLVAPSKSSSGFSPHCVLDVFVWQARRWRGDRGRGWGGGCFWACLFKVQMLGPSMCGVSQKWQRAGLFTHKPRIIPVTLSC